MRINQVRFYADGNLKWLRISIATRGGLNITMPETRRLEHVFHNPLNKQFIVLTSSINDPKKRQLFLAISDGKSVGETPMTIEFEGDIALTIEFTAGDSAYKISTCCPRMSTEKFKATIKAYYDYEESLEVIY